MASYIDVMFHYDVGGRIILFDRKMLRNFRKDGHNWKKKKDGRTVKEAHEHLKVRFCSLYLKRSYHEFVSCSANLRPLDDARLVTRKGFTYTMRTVKITLPLFGGVIGYWISM